MRSILGLIADVQTAILNKDVKTVTEQEKELSAALEHLYTSVVKMQEKSNFPAEFDKMTVRQIRQALLISETDKFAIVNLLAEQTSIIKSLDELVKRQFSEGFDNLILKLNACETKEDLEKFLPKFDEIISNPFYPEDLLEKAARFRASTYVKIYNQSQGIVSYKKIDGEAE